jgi:fructose-1,6-bisphosphatase
MIAAKNNKELIYDEGSLYVTVFDPLDGSSNIDAAIPTGTKIILMFNFLFVLQRLIRINFVE